MKKYKINVGGKGAEVYINTLDDNQVQNLKEYDLNSITVEEVNEVLNGDSFMDTDIIYIGPYSQQDCWYITVENEIGEIIAKLDEEWEIEPSNDFNDYEVVYDNPNHLIAEDNVKGNYYSYELELEEDFDLEKLTSIVTEVGDSTTIITGLRYDGKLLENKEFDGGVTSKGLYFRLT